MFCPSCGSETPSGDRFCRSCGVSLVGGTDAGASLGAVDIAVEPARPGTLFAERYQISGELGRGGMGIVYQGYDTRLDDQVAIKVLMPHHAANPGVLKRFLAEVTSARKLTHPNIVKVFDLGEAADTVYFTMEFLEGHDLDEILTQEGTFSVQRTAEILNDTCSALDAAHEARLVHRDIKLENIYLTLGGEVKVLDFGVAKVLDRLTTGSTGQMIGTPAYMAPEQVSPGAEVDFRADIYAMGVCAFRMLTGRLPFDASDPLECALQHVHSLPPSPRSFQPSIPVAVEEVVLRAMAKDPERRHASAGDLGRALTEAAGVSLDRSQAPVEEPRTMPKRPASGGPTKVRESGSSPVSAVRNPAAPALPAPPDAHWSVLSDGKISNEVDRGTLKQWITEGRVAPTDHARVSGGPWHALTDYPDFLENLAEAPEDMQAAQDQDFHAVPESARIQLQRGQLSRLIAWVVAIALLLGAYGTIRLGLVARAVAQTLPAELDTLYYDDPQRLPNGTKIPNRRIASKPERTDSLRAYALRHGIAIDGNDVRLVVDKKMGNLHMDVPYTAFILHIPVPRRARVQKPLRLRNDGHLKDFLDDPAVCYVGVRKPDVVAWIAERTALGRAVPEFPCLLDELPQD